MNRRRLLRVLGRLRAFQARRAHARRHAQTPSIDANQPVFIFLGVRPMPYASTDDFRVTARCLHPDYIVTDDPVVIGQHRPSRKFALALHVYVMPRDALKIHYQLHRKCERCHGTGELADPDDFFGGQRLCREPVEAPPIGSVRTPSFVARTKETPKRKP